MAVLTETALAGRKRQPGYEGKYLPGNAVVENPYAATNPSKPTVEAGRNYAESPSAMLFKRGDIDAAQERADGKFRRLYEASQGGKSEGVIDPSNEPVDNSRGRGDGFTDRRLKAIAELDRLKNILGSIDYRIMCQVSGNRLSLTEVASIWDRSDNPSKAMRLYIGRRYKDGLLVLAREFGYVS